MLSSTPPEQLRVDFSGDLSEHKKDFLWDAQLLKAPSNALVLFRIYVNTQSNKCATLKLMEIQLWWLP